jgi:hypothetical protein
MMVLWVAAVAAAVVYSAAPVVQAEVPSAIALTREREIPVAPTEAALANAALAPPAGAAPVPTPPAGA